MASSVSATMEKTRSASPRSDFLAVPEFVSAASSSPASLSVPETWWGGASLGSVTAAENRRASSATSSIFDLSAEWEQLERALRENDVGTVKRFLQLHHVRMPLDSHASCLLDKSSFDSHSRRQSHASQDVDIIPRKSPAVPDSSDRQKDAETTEDVANILRSSLHVAIQHNSVEVLRLLLKHGLDPNEPSSAIFRPRSPCSSSYSSGEVPNTSTTCTAMPVSHSHHHQNVLVEPSVQHFSSKDSNTTDKDCVLQKDHQHSVFNKTQLLIPGPSMSSSTYMKLKQQHPVHCDARVATEPSPGATSCSPGNKRVGYTVNQLPDIVETLVPREFNFSRYSSKEELLALPCLFLAVVEGNAYVVQILLRYSAQPNIQDSHGCSPLHLACSQDYYNMDIIRCLLKYGARIHLKNAYDVSPFSLCPDVLSEQKAIIKTIMTKVNFLPPRSRTSTGVSQNPLNSPLSLTPTHELISSASTRSGSISRFFKRLSSDSKSGSRDRRTTRDESSNTNSEVMRERTHSSGSYRSQRSRHLSTCVQEDLDSDTSLLLKKPGTHFYSWVTWVPPFGFEATTRDYKRI